MKQKVTSELANAVLSYITKEWLEELGVGIDFSKSLVISIRGIDRSLKGYKAIFGGLSQLNEDLLRKKAEVVFVTGMNCRDANEKANQLKVDILELVPGGTAILGAAPILDEDGDKVGVVSVTGQSPEMDQVLANVIGTSTEYGGFFEFAARLGAT